MFGLTEFICPECGSDLRDVGINTPRARLTISTGNAIFLAFALLCCVGGGAAVFWPAQSQNAPIPRRAAGPQLAVPVPAGVRWASDKNGRTYQIDVPHLESVGLDLESFLKGIDDVSELTFNMSSEQIIDVKITVDGGEYRIGDFAKVEKVEVLPDTDAH